MKEQELTPWFVNGEKPARPGVYNVSCRKLDQSGDWWSHWNGEAWSDASTDKKKWQWRGYDLDGLFFSAKGSWRGLAQDPEAKP